MDLTLENVIKRMHFELHEQFGLRDNDILGTAAQPQDTWVGQYDIYVWYYILGMLKRPQDILELGVRFGYGGVALSKGAMFCGGEPFYIGVDSQADGIQSNQIALDNLNFLSRRRIIQVDTSDHGVNDAIGKYYNLFDIVHVDGDHSEQGIQNELAIAARQIEPEGWILVDDILNGPIEKHTLAFCAERGITPIYLPTWARMILIDMGQMRG